MLWNHISELQYTVVIPTTIENKYHPIVFPSKIKLLITPFPYMKMYNVDDICRHLITEKYR